MKKIIFLISLILLSGCSIRTYSNDCGCGCKTKQTSIDVGVVCDDSGCLEDEW